MTKKNIVLLLVIVCFLAVMCISIWGKQPELDSRVPVTDLIICTMDGEAITDINENSGRKEKMVTTEHSTEYTEENPFTYEFLVKVMPENATDVSLEYEIFKGEEVVTVTQSTEGNVHHFVVTFSEQSEAIIKFTTNKKDTVKSDYILFTWTGSDSGGDVEIPLF